MAKKKSKHDLHKRKAAKKGRAFSGARYVDLPEDVELFTPEGKTYKLDILPYKVTDESHPDEVEQGDTWYTRPFMIHKDVGVNNERIVCPRSIGEPCPICEEAESLSRSGDADKDTLRALWPKNRALYNVVDIQADEPVVMVLDYSTFLFGELLEKRVAQDLEERGDFFELENGCTLICDFEEKKGTGSDGQGFTSFPCVSIDFKSREDYDDELLEQVVNLDGVLMILTYEEIEAKFQGIGEDDVGEGEEEEPEEEEKPKRSVGGRRRKKKEPEEEPEEEKGEEEEEEEKPRRRRRKKKEPEEEEGNEEDGSQEQESSPEPSSEKSEDGEDGEGGIDPDDVPDGYVICPACEGRGKNTRGRTCRICKGEGYIEDPEAEEEEEKPKKRRSGRRRK